MIRRWWTRRARVLRGLVRTRIRGHRTPYDADHWWDERFFTKGMSDPLTISPRKSAVSAAHHYASVELLITRHLRNRGSVVDGQDVLDLGSGAGHWIDFYLSLGAARCDGMDVSDVAMRHLEDRFGGHPRVELWSGRIGEVLDGLAPGSYHLVNAIGVMFHLVDDTEWRRAVDSIAGVLRPGGLLVVGGHFGVLDGVNVQFDEDGTVNKRLRSARRWKASLREAGFDEITVHRNRAYLFIDDTLPENSVLVARRSSGEPTSPGV